MEPSSPPPAAVRALLLAGLALLAGALLVLGGCAGTPSAAADPGSGGIDLRTAPWYSQPGGSPSIHAVAPWDSAEFAPGVTYAEALDHLARAALGDGALPAGAVLRDSLPAEVVYVAPGPGDGIRVSLTAPWGWAPATGAIRPPSYRLPGALDPEEAADRAREARADGTLPDGATVDVPDLPACQVADGTPEERPACP